MKNKLSAHSLGLFLECKRCFWLAMNGRRRPSGPMSTLPLSADLMIKKYFDASRPKLPASVKIDGCSIVSQEEVVKLRGNVKFEKYGFVLTGRFDDCAVKNGKYLPLDYKTRGFDVKEVHSSYQLQLDVYALLLRENGFSIGKDGYLVYFVFDRDKYKKLSNSFPHKIDVRKLSVSADRALRVFRDAVKFLHGKCPSCSKECDWCAYTQG